MTIFFEKIIAGGSKSSIPLSNVDILIVIIVVSAPEMHDKSGEAVFTRLRELYLKAKELSEIEVK